MEFTDEELLFVCTNPEELHLIVLPTEKCNFKCLYCYEDHDVGKMSDATVGAIENFLRLQVVKLKHLTIDWFGGEPLLGMPIIRRINRCAQETILASGKATWFRSGMTTNGYLLNRETFDELTRLGVNQYQITLDGPRELHNSTRVQVNGGETFDRIWKNLLMMKESTAPFDVLLRVHLTNSNLQHIPTIVNLIDEEFGGDKRFKIFLKPIKNLGGCGGAFAAREGIEDGDAVAREMETKLQIGNSFWQPNAICHASKFNSLMFRADGSISKCTTALSDPINNIGRVLHDGNLAIDREKILKWSRGLFSMDRDQLYCPLGGIDKCSGCGESDPSESDDREATRMVENARMVANA